MWTSLSYFQCPQIFNSVEILNFSKLSRFFESLEACCSNIFENLPPMRRAFFLKITRLYSTLEILLTSF